MHLQTIYLVCAPMHVLSHTNMHICFQAHEHYTHTLTSLHMYTHLCTDKYVYTYPFSIYIILHIYMHIHTCMNMCDACTCVSTSMHICACVYTGLFFLVTKGEQEAALGGKSHELPSVSHYPKPTCTLTSPSLKCLQRGMKTA